MQRPEDLAADTAQVIHVCAHLLKEFATNGERYEAFGVLLPTSPLRSAHDVRQAYAIFQRGEADYVMSLVPFEHPPQRAVCVADGRVHPYFGLENMRQTQHLDPLYRHDGAVIFARAEAFLKERQFYGPRVAPYFIAPDRSVDIDSPLDLAWAEFLLTRAPQG